MDAPRPKECAVDRMPAFDALEVRIEFEIWRIVVEFLQSFRAVEPQPRYAHEAINVLIRGIGAHRIVDAVHSLDGAGRRTQGPNCESPHPVTRLDAGEPIQHAEQAMRLEPDVAGEPF